MSRCDLSSAHTNDTTLDRQQWVQQAGNPVRYAQHARKQPLPGNAAKPVTVQFAKGDQTVPNRTTSALIRAGDLEDRATYFRNDLAFAANPGTPKNTTIDPDGAAGPLFEVPVALPLPETLTFIP